MNKSGIALVAGLALAMTSSAFAQNRPAAPPAAPPAAGTAAVSPPLSFGQTVAALVKEDGLNICVKKPDKKKCPADSR